MMLVTSVWIISSIQGISFPNIALIRTNVIKSPTAKIRIFNIADILFFIDNLSVVFTILK